MCIPHGMSSVVSNFTFKAKKEPKHIEKPSKNMLEKGDPKFIDERTKPYKPKKKKGFFSSLFK